jgi:predicted nuclease with TOPRIM domain
VRLKLSEGKELIKRRLLNFYNEHTDFDDKNPNLIKEAEALVKELEQLYGRQALIEAIEEFRDEAERAVAEARKRRYEAIKRMRNKYTKT